MKTATSPLTGDSLRLEPVTITAEEATQLRHYASRGAWKMPVSQLERDLYAAKGMEPPA
ncbi:hypothetical protein BN970_00007 [Mycolicibacterium conceptionense]|uniref:Uncharacterized protein n=1 Tax=Mycolicibacterium conceptionense TaxID=451644 RepID=A0A0U1CUB7_9MYCO|nr:hypothetical protein BN970_00007 [Mycolicibacterium conceptionense]